MKCPICNCKCEVNANFYSILGPVNSAIFCSKNKYVHLDSKSYYHFVDNSSYSIYIINDVVMFNIKLDNITEFYNLKTIRVTPITKYEVKLTLPFIVEYNSSINLEYLDKLKIFI